MRSDIDLLSVRAALSYLNTDDRAMWVRMGMAVKSFLGEAGFAVWDEWAQGSVDSGGPFESEEAALLDVLRLYGVEDDSLPTTKENEDANP